VWVCLKRRTGLLYLCKPIAVLRVTMFYLFIRVFHTRALAHTHTHTHTYMDTYTIHTQHGHIHIHTNCQSGDLKEPYLSPHGEVLLDAGSDPAETKKRLQQANAPFLSECAVLTRKESVQALIEWGNLNLFRQVYRYTHAHILIYTYGVCACMKQDCACFD
jgi:hypothetical protein